MILKYDYSRYSIRELVIAYGSVVSGMRDYERDGLEYKQHYKDLCEREQEIMAEAERRDDRPEGLDE
jgi:hypothetical protein